MAKFSEYIWIMETENVFTKRWHFKAAYRKEPSAKRDKKQLEKRPEVFKNGSYYTPTLRIRRVILWED